MVFIIIEWSYDSHESSGLRGDGPQKNLSPVLPVIAYGQVWTGPVKNSPLLRSPVDQGIFGAHENPRSVACLCPWGLDLTVFLVRELRDEYWQVCNDLVYLNLVKPIKTDIIFFPKYFWKLTNQNIFRVFVLTNTPFFK